MAEIVDTAKDEAEIAEEQKARVAEMAMVSEMVASLPESQKPIADMLFGLNGKPVSVTKEIRKALGVNTDRILRVKQTIIRDMKRKVEEDDFLRNNRRRIREIIDSLPAEQQRIAERLFPTRSKAKQAVKVIAAEFGVGDSWVYMIQKKVMRLVAEKSGAKA
jgi:DNA-directed RNA polymerase specialized sigma subunit